jgi:hypothetical protein
MHIPISIKAAGAAQNNSRAGKRLTPWGSVAIDYRSSLGRYLVDGEPDMLYQCLLEAARFLGTVTAAEVLAAVFGDSRMVYRLLTLVAGIDHLGFVVPRQSEASVRAAAVAAGFDLHQWSFPSRIVARELGELSGHHSPVPTTVFKARGSSLCGGTMDVEVFMPQVESTVIHDWIRAGIGNHIAFSIADRSFFAEVARVMEAEGYHLPTFMEPALLTNEAEQITVVYFDSPYPDSHPRLEFCYYG